MPQLQNFISLIYKYLHLFSLILKNILIKDVQTDKSLPEASGTGRAGVPELVPLRRIPKVLAIRRSFTKIKKNNQLYLVSIFLI
jgi:hypothetical protein